MPSSTLLLCWYGSGLVCWCTTVMTFNVFMHLGLWSLVLREVHRETCQMGQCLNLSFFVRLSQAYFPFTPGNCLHYFLFPTLLTRAKDSKQTESSYAYLWDEVSGVAQDFVKKLLVVKPASRRVLSQLWSQMWKASNVWSFVISRQLVFSGGWLLKKL